MAAAYGLTGYPLSHSFSPAYFGEKFARLGIDATYQPFPIAAISELPYLLHEHSELHGLNVTIPYKEQVIPYLHGLSPEAAAIGAVNCIDIRNGILTGYNTDATGFRQSLEPLLQQQHTRALVLGTGGAARAVTWVLDQLGVKWQQVSRNGKNEALTYEQVTPELLATHMLLINTTPVGMYPHVTDAPALPYTAIGTQHLLYDLVYNPKETRFLAHGREQGAVIKNGHDMLILQAEAAWAIWNS